jgi:hypothetical protein
VKKSEPTKKVMPIPGRGVDAHCDATAASAKHSDPMPNSAASQPAETPWRLRRSRDVQCRTGAADCRLSR